MQHKNYIAGKWQAGSGPQFTSVNPANGAIVWSGNAANASDVDMAFTAARQAFPAWSALSLEARKEFIVRYQNLARVAKDTMAALISQETGKLLWDSRGEGGALAAKVDISLEAYADRTGHMSRDTAFGHANLQHRAHGVFAVLGPYNFPAHLPNGQIIPALIAGNTVVFKPSEQTPAVGAALIALFDKAGFPPGVINMVQGARDTGATILNNSSLDGLLFTGSAQTGALIHRHFGGRPEIVLALEMGGNNPLIVWDATDAEAAASLIAQSAFMSSGQRCTCARRLVISNDHTGKAVIAALEAVMDRLTIGAWDDADEASLGPLVSSDIAKGVIAKTRDLEARGATALRPSRLADRGGAFVKPGLYDVTECDIADEEIFGPVLKVIRVEDWDRAIEVANATRFGLAAGLISDDENLWADFRARIRAGVVNFNRPTTGAASFLPFGGPGASGNHNPGAYYSADFCAWPMASQVAAKPEMLPIPGIRS